MRLFLIVFAVDVYDDDDSIGDMITVIYKL